MSDGSTIGTARSSRRLPRLQRVRRRGPILRPSLSGSRGRGIYGLDLTAGCLHSCPFCYLRGSELFPGEGRVLFDPGVPDQLPEALRRLPERPSLIVLSPLSDPLPPSREVRDASLRAARFLLESGLNLQILTRGRIPGSMVALLADHREIASVGVGITTLDRILSRTLEPIAALPAARLKGIERLSAAGVPVEVRLEPLILGLTDTSANLGPLFRALAGVGAGRVIAHYLFQHPAMIAPLSEAMAPLGWSERFVDDFGGGPVFPVGSLGAVKNLPLNDRKAGLARLIAWGAEHGLTIQTGAGQNPDLPRPWTLPRPRPEPERAGPPAPGRGRSKSKATAGKPGRAAKPEGLAASS